MDNILSGILIAVVFVLGLVAGAVFLSTSTEVEVPGEVQYQNKTVEIIVEVPGDCDVCLTDWLQSAVNEFMTAVDDEEDEAGNDVDALRDYDFDEISISKVYNDYTIEYDGDKTTVNFEIKLKYDEDNEKSEKVRYDVEVIFEDNEDTIVEIL